MHTWRLADVGLFFTFFLTPFCLASFSSFLGTLQNFFSRTAPLRQPFGPYSFFFLHLVGFFFKSFLGASVPLHS